MKLDRNITKPRRGKYALIRLREWPHGWSPAVQDAFRVMAGSGAIDFGDTEDSDFFVIRLKDKYAHAALSAYASAAAMDDNEYSKEVKDLAILAFSHPSKRVPD